MIEIRKNENQRKEIVVKQDSVFADYCKLAKAAYDKGLLVEGGDVNGDLKVRVEYKLLIDNIQRKWQELERLTARLTEVDTLLDQLYHSKFEEFATRLNVVDGLRHNIQPLRNRFESALASRTAGNLLERIQLFLEERTA